MKRFLPALLATVASAFCQAPPPAAPNLGDAEAQRIEERINSVRRDVLGKYEIALGELQNQFQKSADLEGALAARNERNRVHSEQSLNDKHLVGDPKNLRALQQTTLSRLNELSAGVVNESVPKLIDYKKQLTIDGKLDEALAVKATIERLQNTNVPLNKADNGSTVTADTLIQSYSADRQRADKVYKGQKLIVRGINGGHRVDPNDAKTVQIYLASSSGGWIECTLNNQNFRFREDKSVQPPTLFLIPKEGPEIRMLKGQSIELKGECNGWDEMVKFAKCEVGR